MESTKTYIHQFISQTTDFCCLCFKNVSGDVYFSLEDEVAIDHASIIKLTEILAFVLSFEVRVRVFTNRRFTDLVVSTL